MVFVVCYEVYPEYALVSAFTRLAISKASNTYFFDFPVVNLQSFTVPGD